MMQSCSYLPVFPLREVVERKLTKYFYKSQDHNLQLLTYLIISMHDQAKLLKMTWERRCSRKTRSAETLSAKQSWKWRLEAEKQFLEKKGLLQEKKQKCVTEIKTLEAKVGVKH